MKTKNLLLFALIVALLTACQPAGPSPKDIAATEVASAAQTEEAAPPTPTNTPAPTETPLPTATITATPEPTLTPTPAGPLTIKDDFASKSDIWGKCDKCEWKDGKLFYGPFEARGQGINQLFPLVCEACGEHSYFRVAVDVAFAAGVGGDRFFGVGGVIPDEFFAGTSITPFQFGCLEAFDFTKNKWSGSKIQRYGSIKPGSAVNRIEFAVKPSASGGYDYYDMVNGKTLIVLSNREALNLKPALYISWHSVGVTFDNFEFEEIEP
jgi:hypothetical protein